MFSETFGDETGDARPPPSAGSKPPDAARHAGCRTPCLVVVPVRAPGQARTTRTLPRSAHAIARYAAALSARDVNLVLAVHPSVNRDKISPPTSRTPGDCGCSSDVDILLDRRRGRRDLHTRGQVHRHVRDARSPANPGLTAELRRAARRRLDHSVLAARPWPAAEAALAVLAACALARAPAASAADLHQQFPGTRQPPRPGPRRYGGAARCRSRPRHPASPSPTTRRREASRAIPSCSASSTSSARARSGAASGTSRRATSACTSIRCRASRSTTCTTTASPSSSSAARGSSPSTARGHSHQVRPLRRRPHRQRGHPRNHLRDHRRSGRQPDAPDPRQLARDRRDGAAFAVDPNDTGKPDPQIAKAGRRHAPGRLVERHRRRRPVAAREVSLPQTRLGRDGGRAHAPHADRQPGQLPGHRQLGAVAAALCQLPSHRARQAGRAPALRQWWRRPEHRRRRPEPGPLRRRRRPRAGQRGDVVAGVPRARAVPRLRTRRLLRRAALPPVEQHLRPVREDHPRLSAGSPLRSRDDTGRATTRSRWAGASTCGATRSSDLPTCLSRSRIRASGRPPFPSSASKPPSDRGTPGRGRHAGPGAWLC